MRATPKEAKMLADCEAEERQSRLDEFAKAALTGILGSVWPLEAHEITAKRAFDAAEAMESERTRRIAGEEPKR